ncbi:hypothetical protein ABEB36_014499 [Hypothenemus hampei]|uniref:MADF domain-containing protein n=1 Tax=Hypothenemus hampei TaxID=57062 RepID=A0ABD1E289_HYPHA
MNVDVEKLISEVQERPALWDMRHSDYANKIIRKRCWEEIVSTFSNDGTNNTNKDLEITLQKKWKNLRDRYAKEIKKKGKSGQGAMSSTPYVHAEQISSFDKNNPYDVSEDEVEHETDQAAQTVLTKESVSIGKKRKLPSVEEKLVEVLENNMSYRQQKQKSEENDDRLFLLSLLPSFKMIPPYNKLSARVEIM